MHWVVSSILVLVILTPLLTPLTPLSSASGRVFEEVESVSELLYLDSSGGLSFGDYFVKLYSVDDESVTLIIYRDDRFVRLFDLYLGETRVYDGYGLRFIEIRDGLPLVGVVLPERRLVWREIDHRVLLWARPVRVGDWEVKATVFGEDYVELETSFGDESYHDLFYEGGEKSYDDRLKICITDIDPEGRAEAYFYEPIRPALNATLHTDKLEYTPDETIHLEVRLPPQPSTDFVTLRITTSSNASVTPHLQSASRLDNGTVFHASIGDLPAASELVITVELSGYDFFGRKYTDVLEKRIMILSTVVAKKSIVPGEVDTTRPVNISLYLYNSRSTSVNLSLVDVLPETIEYITTPPRNLSLGAKNNTTIVYSVLPTQPGLFTLDGTDVSFDGVTITSNEVQLLVHGPLISIEKRLVKLDGDLATIEVEITNRGDLDADLIFRDKLPLDSELLSGGTIWADVLQAGESVTMEYTIRLGADRISPPGTATYSDLRGTEREVRSNLLHIKGDLDSVEDEEVALRPKEALCGIFTSFILLFAIIVSVVGGIYLWLRHRGG